MIDTILIDLGTSFVGSMLGFVVALHYDLPGKWEQIHIEKGRKMEEKNRKKKSIGPPPDPTPGIGDIGRPPHKHIIIETHSDYADRAINKQYEERQRNWYSSEH